jgi:CheY-like chemotaxis protein/DNA-binding MarR family transcriptional regulator
MAEVTEPEVLVVDDDEQAVGLVARVLETDGHACRTAGCAAEGMSTLAAAQSIDVVVSDIYMPTTDGLEFLSAIRRRFADRPWLQLILITGQASVDTAVAAMRLEASDYLIKPLDARQLRESVRHALSRARSIREVRSARGDTPRGRELRLIADAARELATQLSGSTRTGPIGEPSNGLRSLELLGRLESARTSIFGEAVMPEPAWEMLAELMRAGLAGKQVTVSSLALASKSPMTTALRRIDDLVAGGLVSRVPDPDDRRRTFVELTGEGRARMQAFLEGFSRLAS